MPLFCDAYLADTMHLTNEESGCYLKLLMVTWRNNGQPLPDDDIRLARTLSVSMNKWHHLRPRMVEFFDISDGTWRQKRLEKEWTFCQKAYEENVRKGRLGGRPKSLKENETEKAPALAGGKPDESPLTLKEVSKEEERKKPLAVARVKKPDAEEDPDFRDWYARYPRKSDPGRAAKAYRAARKIASAADLLDGALRYSAECDGKDQQFVKMPASWLGAHSWKNEPLLPGTTNGHGRHHSAADGIAAGFAAAIDKRSADWGDDRGPAEPLRLGGHAPSATRRSGH
jgi:uncharacterized protein YdaU (DUF1376 family)